MNNHRSLMVGWQMYVNDNQDRLPYASDTSSKTSYQSANWPLDPNDPNVITPGVWIPGIMDFKPTVQNHCNWDPQALTLSPLWNYVGRSAAIFKCPADPSSVNINGTVFPRIRTMAMNLWLGGFAGSLYNDSNLKANSSDPLTTWAFYLKYGDLSKGGGGAANIFVFLDMRPDSINVGNFGVCMDGYPNGGSAAAPGKYRFWDLPGNQHNGSCSFSYADGHSAAHKWTDSKTTPPYDYKNGSPGTFTSPNNADVAALQQMATRPLQ